jgi:hypothetical protein
MEIQRYTSRTSSSLSKEATNDRHYYEYLPDSGSTASGEAPALMSCCAKLSSPYTSSTLPSLPSTCTQSPITTVGSVHHTNSFIQL